MFRSTLIAVLAAILAVGCAARTPVAPEVHPPPQAASLTAPAFHDPHRLCGEWTFFINKAHDKVDVVPRRMGRFHLNSLKFLEDYCADCLKITNIHNNGDGTIDLTVRITHPFPGHPEFTGFDVKGIIMFKGSHLVPFWAKTIFPYGDPPPDNNYFYVSWKDTGDPEVLNADGYTVLWSPWWDSDKPQAIFNYWPGKYSNGTPTANINGYLNFYTDEERHMFRCDDYVERTYQIWLPPGPVVAGYAVDACWEPPTVTPVQDPVSDFPITANQPEPYYYRYVVFNGEVVDESCCGGPDQNCMKLRHECKLWYGPIPRHSAVSYPPWPKWMIKGGNNMQDCEETPPAGMYWLDGGGDAITSYFGDGDYRGVAVLIYGHLGEIITVTYDVFDFTIDLE